MIVPSALTTITCTEDSSTFVKTRTYSPGSTLSTRIEIVCVEWMPATRGTMTRLSSGECATGGSRGGTAYAAIGSGAGAGGGEETACARVTVSVYVWMVEPSCAVTTTWIVFAPMSSDSADDASPESTATHAPPLIDTQIVAPACAAAGVTVMAVTTTETVDVYDVVPEAKVGAKVATPGTSPDSVASADCV